MFIYLHILLEVAVYAEFTYEVFGFCREMDTGLVSLCVPYVLLVIKTVFFYLCITRDPGLYNGSGLCTNTCFLFMKKIGVIVLYGKSIKRYATISLLNLSS